MLACLAPRPSPRRILALSLSLVTLVATPARAQEDDGQLWFQANTNVPLADDLRITLEQIARFGERDDGLYTTEFGALLEHRVAKGVRLGFGYRRVDAHNGSDSAGENRLRQQVVAAFGRVSTRFRVDERFSAAGGETGFRVRPLIRYDHPIGRRGHALFVSHESFLLPNSTAWGQRRGYERMRNVAGVTLPFGRQISADIGYLNQYRVARGGARAEMEHALSLQLTIDLDA
jgi:hypothetical protein